MRITDLEKFALDHIVRPYQYTGGFGEKRVKSLPCSLNDLVARLQEKTKWSELVLSRISEIKFQFPDYIDHKLVILVKRAQGEQ